MIKKISRNLFGQLVECILEGGACKATKYLSPQLTVKATAILYKGEFYDKKKTILFTIGKPNYAEREFIKLAQKAGENFPIKKIQLKWPKKDERGQRSQ